MSRQTFDDDCPGCRPAMINPQTGKVYAADSPPMQAVMRVWAELTREEKEAFHHVTCENSRSPWDLAIMRAIVDTIEKELKDLPYEEA